MTVVARLWRRLNREYMHVGAVSTVRVYRYNILMNETNNSSKTSFIHGVLQGVEKFERFFKINSILPFHARPHTLSLKDILRRKQTTRNKEVKSSC